MFTYLTTKFEYELAFKQGKAHIHISDLNSQNFGIQEAAIFGENSKEVFPGCPELRDGMMWSNGKPGLGIDINEELAKKFPFRERVWGGAWDTVRRADGGVVKP